MIGSQNENTRRVPHKERHNRKCLNVDGSPKKKFSKHGAQQAINAHPESHMRMYWCDDHRCWHVTSAPRLGENRT